VFVSGILLLLQSAKDFVPQDADKLALERELTYNYVDSAPTRILTLDPAPETPEEQPEAGYSTPRNIFLAGRSDILFVLSSEDIQYQRLKMYRRHPGPHPDKAEWEIRFLRDPKARRGKGIGRILELDLRRIHSTVIRKAITSPIAFVSYWGSFPFGGWFVDVYMPKARREVTISDVEPEHHFPTTTTERDYVAGHRAGRSGKQS
jgi:hypothetical protein